MHIPITTTHEGFGSFKMPTDWREFWIFVNSYKQTGHWMGMKK
jgi:hypothetical protein